MEKKKNLIRIIIGIIIAIVLIIAGADEIRESLGKVRTSIENLKEDIKE